MSLFGSLQLMSQAKGLDKSAEDSNAGGNYYGSDKVDEGGTLEFLQELQQILRDAGGRRCAA